MSPDRDWDPGGLISPEARAKIILELQARTGFRTFVETGSAEGDMVAAVMHAFDRVYTIEFHASSYLHCFRRFAAHPKVTCLHGDSEELLWHVCEVLHEPAIFWLDAHMPGGSQAPKETPILGEVKEILGRSGKVQHLLLIDDARLFGIHPLYPTQAKIRQMAARYPGYSYAMVDDIMRVIPPGV